MKELKAKVRQIMLDHLAMKGYPNMTEEQTLAELKPMWIKFEEAHLIQPGWRYARFVETATAVAVRLRLRSDLQAQIFKHFARRPR